jgi:hypothetical protein
MHTHRKGLTIGLSALAGLALIALVLLTQRVPPSPPLIAATAATQEFGISPDTLVGWDRGPAQPVFFSHRRHAGVFQIDCLYCHTNTDKSPVAPMPSLDVCLGCHTVVRAASPEIQRLRGFRERGEAVPWVRIYKLADFVQFNHSRHIQAEVQCQDCHGAVEETDVLYRSSPLTMGWCLECHLQPADEEALTKAARTAAKFEAAGYESRGLYPRSIDSDYGVTKAPIDCAACHY